MVQNSHSASKMHISVQLLTNRWDRERRTDMLIFCEPYRDRALHHSIWTNLKSLLVEVEIPVQAMAAEVSLARCVYLTSSEPMHILREIMSSKIRKGESWLEETSTPKKYYYKSVLEDYMTIDYYHLSMP